jgi:hypothetical protein
MQPRWHILFSFFLSYIVVYFFNFSLLSGTVIFLSGILIDLDHLLLFYLESKTIHPKKFLLWNEMKKELWQKLTVDEKNQFKSPHFILHGMEFLLFLVFLSIFHPFFIWVFIGIISHLILDWIDLYFSKSSRFFVKISQIKVWLDNKGKKDFLLSFN